MTERRYGKQYVKPRETEYIALLFLPYFSWIGEAQMAVFCRYLGKLNEKSFMFSYNLVH